MQHQICGNVHVSITTSRKCFHHKNYTCLLQNVLMYTTSNIFIPKTCPWQTISRRLGIIDREPGSSEPIDAREDDHEPIPPPMGNRAVAVSASGWELLLRGMTIQGRPTGHLGGRRGGRWHILRRGECKRARERTTDLSPRSVA
jgi:hypothetical protein